MGKANLRDRETWHREIGLPHGFGEVAEQEAVSRSNLEDAVRLALTVDVKWGDYDPEGIESGWDE